MLVVPPADPLAVSPVIRDRSADRSSTETSTGDRAASSPAPPPGRNRPSALPRRKPAPLPPALEVLSRRPTRPSLPGRSSTLDLPALSDEIETTSSLKRKQVLNRKKDGPKKGKQ